MSIRVPHHWVESEDEEPGTYAFFDNDDWSGTMRLSVVRKQLESKISAEDLMNQVFEDHEQPNVKFFKIDNDYVAAHWDEAAENEENLHMYWWTVSALVSPKLIRRALFSFAVNEEIRSKPDFAVHLAMVQDCVFAVHFSTDNPN